MNNIFGRSLAHLVNSWRHHAGLQFSTIVILSASFSAVLAVLTLTTNLQNILTLWGDSLQMSIFVNESVSEEKMSNLKTFLSKNQKIENVKYVSSEKALLDFKEQMSSYAPDLLNDADLLKFIPTSFQISLKNLRDSDSQIDVMRGLAAEIKSFEGVDEVSFGQEWVKNYSLITKVVSSAGVIFIFITILGSLFVVSNSIRTSVVQRKNEIEVLELIGATSSYIRWPFIAEGAILGMLSTVISVGVSYGLFSWAKSGLQQQLNFLQLSSHVQFLSAQMSFFFILAGMLLGALSALLCVRQINSGWAAARSQRKLNGD